MSNGNGNSDQTNGMTTRDILVRLDAKMDAMDLRVREIELAGARTAGEEHGRRSAMTVLDRAIVGTMALILGGLQIATMLGVHL
jgi:hypothetical protein